MKSIQLNDRVLILSTPNTSYKTYVGSIGQVKRILVDDKGQPYHVNVKLIDRSIVIDIKHLQILVKND